MTGCSTSFLYLELIGTIPVTTASFICQDSLANQGLIILIRDITKLQKLRVIANRNNRMKELGEMAASVAHEIRNPLGGIEGFATLLSRDLVDQPEQQQMAHYIIEGTKSLNRLVTNVLNYTRPMHLELQICNINEVIDDVIKITKTDSHLNKNINIKFEILNGSIFLSIDKILIKSALLNTIINGIQAMSNGGELTIKSYRKDESANIEISDNGEGISEENIEKIFSPFFTTKHTGSGIGLAETHKIIQAHGGTIEVDSKCKDGTTFIIKIPFKQ